MKDINACPKTPMKGEHTTPIHPLSKGVTALGCQRMLKTPMGDQHTP